MPDDATPRANPVTPTFFAAPAEFRAWLEHHHEGAQELWVGFHKKGSGGPVSPGPTRWMRRS